VKFVATATTGFEHIDIEYLKQNNIEFFVAKGANSNSVAEYIIFSLLFWSKHNVYKLLEEQVGIIGFGNIGTKVAGYLDKLGINYLLCDPFVEDTIIGNEELKSKFRNIDEIINECDIITTHIPFTIDGLYPTYNLINKDRINKMKDGALLVCTSRGDVCDEVAMINNIDRLDYIIDVWHNEPFIDNRDLLQKAVLSTPHIAGHTYNGKFNATVMIINKLIELYGYNLSIPSISIENTNDISKIIEVKDLKKIYLILMRNRGLEETSLKMKAMKDLSASDFAKYFKVERKN
jgi:erythronate-4-phosphate dehydrogenase